ncbi:MAG TPA: FeoB-associated Cys-rich membrane protein [Bacteroidales bacterium]|nr:FeoB-associated Cys-rich membrane protein [Bacteroidales bacterium]HRS17977.1 FeoB-associated Cys-rich membrane protein [Bacteroidales bacterium]
MIQEIFVYIILSATIVYIVRSLYQSLKPHKRNNTCSGCNGCSLQHSCKQSCKE